ncbi:endonuclease/exonuclease/phosphatase family protein [Luteithermobacter gelatinilyticus]|uniref:endonuclease/exonuclease/phosphatase family protein n=1 Tax=Luteithermobacter gelatinilyticus TaxID=2582913 RepID=UPI001105D7DE|nr:endonuclease/exonuclease/phosphatase family protein [Luteithermobacter gelatinilyticus]
MSYKILFSNIGYAKGIDGSLKSHMRYFHRHFYANISVQKQVLHQLKNLIETEMPDLCCFVEIDRGSVHSAQLNQIHELMDEEYTYHDIADKYGENSLLGRLPLHAGKSNAFLAKAPLPFERLYFGYGRKRLIYKLILSEDIHVFFAHFSLNQKIRLRQFEEVYYLVRDLDQEVILLADFNILKGFRELNPLLETTALTVLNKEEEPTFTFHRKRHALDLCLCTPGIAERADLKIIPQPFSDHAALLLNIHVQT